MDIIAKPFGYLLRFCYDITSSYALALLFFTLLFKLILLPLSIKQQKNSVAQARIRPKEMAIRKRYAGRTDQNARMELSNDLMRLYQEEKVSAAGGCLPLLIQLPIVYVLYQIITKPLEYICMVSATAVSDIKNKIFDLFTAGTLTEANTSKRIFELFGKAGSNPDKFNISQIEMITVMEGNEGAFTELLTELGHGGIVFPDFTIFGGAMNLSALPTFASIMILIPIFAALFQFASTFVMKLFGPPIDMSAPGAEQTQKTMLYMNIIFPALTFFMAFNFPAILGLYWIYQSIFGAITQIILYKVFPIPVFTPEEMAAVEEEMNRDYVRPTVRTSSRSLHSIDDDEYDAEYVDQTEEEDSEDEAEDAPSAKPNPTPSTLPPRRRYDKNGNKIRSLHFIDDDDEEDALYTEKKNDIGSENSTESKLNDTESDASLNESEAVDTEIGAESMKVTDGMGNTDSDTAETTDEHEKDGE